MKRRYEVTYYEYGLTRRMSCKFFTAIAAMIYYLYVSCKHGAMSYTRIFELKQNYERAV